MSPVRRFRNILLVAAFVFPAAALAQTPRGEPVGRPAGSAYAAGSRLLTPDEIRNARPRPLPELSEDEMRRLLGGKLPSPPGRVEAEPMKPGNVKDIPLKWAGKLFYSPFSGGTWTCSAQFIEPKILVTAAHCLTDGSVVGNGSANFYLQYADGKFSEVYTVNSVWYWGRMDHQLSVLWQRMGLHASVRQQEIEDG